MKSTKKIYPIFYNFIAILFGAMMAGILFINLFVANKREFPCKKKFLFSNIKLLIIGIVVFAILVLIYNKFIKKYVDKLTKKQCNILLLIYFFVTFILQIYIINKIFFLSGWDVAQLRVATDQLMEGIKLNQGNSFNTYLQIYPNNLFLLFIFVIISKIAYICSIDSHLLMSIVSALSVNLSIIMMIKIIGKISKNKHMCVLFVFISTLFLMFSPWIVIPYSDTYAMFFTTSVLYIFFNKENLDQYVYIFVLVLISLIGYKIKPTVIISIIAIAIIEIWSYLFGNKKLKLDILFKSIIAIVLSVLLFGIINNFSKSFLGYERNVDVEMPMTHFMMMGMNEKMKGVFLYEDVEYTTSFKGIDNKKTANIKEIKKRLNQYGVNGYLQLLIDKSLINYDDGSFAWGIEGNFYQKTISENKSIFLKKMYYNNGEYYKYFESYLQSIWLLILFMSIFSIFKIRNHELLVINLTIIGITLFLLLFEARARYLFLYSPYYLLLFVIGTANIYKKIDSKMKNMRN